MAQYARKEKTTVNLVRKQNGDTYRVVDDQEMFHLKAQRRVVPEGKMREDGKFIGSFYIELEG
ncbi:hypothetical protein SEA_FAUST_101 [Streptomyces phage Faust]|uniref:Uncharacterized protein n=1 Tax=Streptomyces phage Faust TaxID=2767565 RepID=A0A7G9UYU3_9CAUD|nr:hypothetical protein PP456_gp161 [Streptomyces phage Faust]QNN99198.1 hypothetical protein SEA_FAUST_101 [Streptomyces phage Faust]